MLFKINLTFKYILKKSSAFHQIFLKYLNVNISSLSPILFFSFFSLIYATQLYHIIYIRIFWLRQRKKIDRQIDRVIYMTDDVK